jgi:hypothetical protein
MNNVSKLSTVYKNYVNEIGYRKSFDDRSKKLSQSFQNQIQKELLTEMVRRNAFQELHGVSSFLRPLAHLLSKPPQSPTISIPNEDIILPELGAISTLEDDFCFVEEGTTEEKLKRIEKEKGELAETLNALTKELALAKKTIEDQTKQLSSLNNVISSKSQNQTPKDENELDVKTLREVNSKIVQEMQTLRKRNQLLVSEVDQSSQKIKDLELLLSSPDVRKMLDMGFDIERIRKALAANNNSVDTAIQWLLESSHV